MIVEIELSTLLRHGIGNAADGLCIGRGPQRCVTFLRPVETGVGLVGQAFGETPIDFVFGPGIADAVLHPFQMADDHTASIDQYIR